LRWWVVIALVQLPIRAGAQPSLDRAAPDANAQARSGGYAPTRWVAVPERAPNPPETHFSGFATPDSGWSIYAGGGGLKLPTSIQVKEGVGSPAGPTLGFQGFAWKYLFADVGLAYLFAADRAKFQETTCGILGGGCGTNSSSVEGFSFSGKVGAQLRFFMPIGRGAFEIAALAGVGARSLRLSRSADQRGDCVDCQNHTLDVYGGLFIGPELELAYATSDQRDAFVIGMKVVYEYFLTGRSTYGLWLSLFTDIYLW
jgi:hypothetical protein